MVSLSSLLVDANSLTWSSEIKVAFLWEKGKRVALLKGGVLSGDIRAGIGHAYYSKQCEDVHFPGDAYHDPIGYKGPSYVLFKEGVSVAGEEQ